MHKLALYTALVFSLSSCALAQSIENFTPCKFGPSSSVGVSNGIAVRRVSITDNRTTYGATVFLPPSDRPVPGILFSHSAMKGTEGSADLLRFAYALSRAGAASIVLDGTMSWGYARSANNDLPSPHLLACAGQWLMLNAPIDHDRIAHAGYHGHWGGGRTPGCMPGEVPCWNLGTWLNFGESADHESPHTKLMFTQAGQIEFANFARRSLGLKAIQPSWLEEAAQP